MKFTLLFLILFLLLIIEPTMSATPAPTSPNNFIITVTSSSSMRLNWTNTATDAQGYRIFRTTMKIGSQTGKVISLKPATVDLTGGGLNNSMMYIDTDLQKNMTFCYCVVCYNAGGESDPEICGCAKTLK